MSSLRTRKLGLRPVVGTAPRILILGTLPGDASIVHQQYYGHPQNAFWRLVSHALNEPVPDGYPARLDLLTRSRIALWDVLHSAEREGSSDSAIRNAVANDVAALLHDASTINVIVFNGQMAQTLFKKHIAIEAEPAGRIDMRCVPSSSPLATLPFERKAALWRAALTLES